MEKTNVYDRARRVVRELVPVLHTIRDYDKSLADQLKRAAQSVVLNIAEARGNDAGTARARFSTACGSAAIAAEGVSTCAAAIATSVRIGRGPSVWGEQAAGSG